VSVHKSTILDRVTSLKRLKLIICFYTLEWFQNLPLNIFHFGANRLKSSSASSKFKVMNYQISIMRNKDIFVDVNLTFELSITGSKIINKSDFINFSKLFSIIRLQYYNSIMYFLYFL
jgi:hypothetical protein